ncbi:MAG: hypothetical protein JNN13_01665 [Planctomycetes bacterium]|nr:hypothetical protein [Planctomycetota bacterium]
MRSLVFLGFAASLAAQGLPPVPVPPQNPITPAKTVLGKLLFWEEQLSSNNRVACGTCHTFGAGGGDLRRVVNPGPDGITPSPDDKFASPGTTHGDASNDYVRDPFFGFGPQVGSRSSPSFLTAAWFPLLFWDGRAGGAFVDPATGVTTIPAGAALENQSIGPLINPVEMAHDGRLFAEVVAKLPTVRPMALASNLPTDMANAIAGGVTYPDLFQAAFGTPDVTIARVAYALATYQRTLVPNQAPYDLFIAGNPNAMTPQQINGMNVFNGPARCNLCHTPGLFSDTLFHNVGLRPIAEDNGRQGVTNQAADAGRFKTPSLRNAGLRGTFMHNGQFTSVPQVFGFYLNGGGPFLQNKDPLLVPLNGPPPGGVPPQAANDLIVFVQTALTDPRVAAGTGPFTRPTLRSELVPEAGMLYGQATLGSGGLFPSMLAGVPANIGNIDFKIGVGNARGGAAATLVLGLAPANVVINGVNLNVQFGGELLVSGMLSGAFGAAGAGTGTLRVPVPSIPELAGLSLYGQWFIIDGGAANGLAATRGAQILFL